MTRWGLQDNAKNWTHLGIEWKQGRQPFKDPNEPRVIVWGDPGHWSAQELLERCRLEDRAVDFLLADSEQ